MDKQSSEFKTLIFDLANGSLDLEHFPVEESKYVENEYEEGKPCYELYAGMHDAYERICHRLDRDVEIVINNLLDIGRHLSLKMYDYGYFFNVSKTSIYKTWRRRSTAKHFKGKNNKYLNACPSCRGAAQNCKKTEDPSAGN